MPLRSYSEADVVLTGRRRLEVTLLLTVWLGVAAFSLADRSVFYVLAGTLAVGVNLLAVRRRQEVYVHRGFVNAGVLLATGVLVMEVLSNSGMLVRPLGHYLILIQLCKLFEHKRNRDYVQLLALSVLLVVAGSILSTSLWMAVLTVVHIAAACYTAMVFTLKRGLDSVAETRLATEREAMNPRQVAQNAIRDWPGRALRRRLGWMMLAVLATGVFMFLVTPRSSWGLDSEAEEGGSDSVSGFSTELRLGAARRIYLSDELLMQVNVSGPAGATAPLYLRGQTLDTYEDSEWSNAAGPLPFGASLPMEAPEDLVLQEVRMSPSLLPNLFAVHPAVAGRSKDGGVRADSKLNLTLSPASVGDDEGWVRYQAWSAPVDDPEAVRRVRRFDYTPPPDLDPREGVEVTPRVRALAWEWCGRLVRQRRALRPGPERDRLALRIGRRISEGLRERCSYTLDLSDAHEERDGVEDFLFHLREGHCEYFASAMVVMCRAMGVHARLAAGFRVDGLSEEGSAWVRGRDAHAWVELYTPSTHWRVFDPTPASAREPEDAWHAPLTGLWRGVRDWWERTVVGYDESARRRLGRWLGDAVAALGSAVRRSAVAVWRGVVDLLIHDYLHRGLQYAALAVTTLGTVVLAIIIARVVRRELRIRRSVGRGQALPWQKLRFYARLVKLLERHGLKREGGVTPREMAGIASVRLDLPAAVLDELVDLYYALRWGKAEISLERARTAERQVAQLKRTLKRRKR